MIQEIKRESSLSGKYGKYFLAFEAPGEDPPPKRNMKVVTVKPNNRARLDFTQNLVVDEIPDEWTNMTMDDPLPEVGDEGMDLPGVDGDTTVPEVDGLGVGDDLPAVDDAGNDPAGIDNQTPGLPEGNTNPDLPDVTEPDTPPEPDPLPDVEVDLGTELPDVDDQVQDDNVVVAPEPAAGEPDFATGGEVAAPPPMDGAPDAGDTEDYTQVGTDTTAPDTGAPPMDAPPTDDAGTGADDNTDFTQVGTGDTTSDTTQANTADATGDGAERGPGLEYDSVRKYNLYKEFVRLRSSIDTYIDKLESCISDDPDSNQIIKEATRRFREIHDLITDYMMMKYELSNYVQNLLFYQLMVGTVQMIFKLLKAANKIYDRESQNRK